LDKADDYFKKGDFENALIEYDRVLKNHKIYISFSADLYKGTCKEYCDTAVLNLEAMLKKDSPDKWMIYDCWSPP
jgi:hypothetical protein